MPEPTVPDRTQEALAAIGALVPRDYQLEILEQAKKENIIAVIETGAGKTLISALLIKYVLSEEYTLARRGRTAPPAAVPAESTPSGRPLVMFIVNHVTLVHQQATFIQKNTPYSVGAYHGQMEIDLWDAPVWDREIDKHRVMVMTAQILRNILLHAFIRMEQIAMIVIDECHHSKEQHPYNEIMREFYWPTPPHRRPKIFAMTASPLDSKDNVGTSAVALENALDARIVSISKELLRKYLKRTRECIVYYASTDQFDTTPLLKRLHCYCYGDYFSQYFLDAEAALRELGPWCADHIWHSFHQAMRRRYAKKAALEKYIGRLESVDDQHRLRRALNILDVHQFDPPQASLAYLSPKVLRLLEVLSKFVTRLPEGKFRGMVFVDRRKHAFALVALLEKLPAMRRIIQCRAMIGSGTSLPGDYQMSFKERQKAVDSFRNGDVNLLVTTTVGEEGLDIPACNVVIRFSFFDTLRAYIQSRGRARHPQSAYVIMQEQGNAEQMKLLQQIRRHEGEMEQWCGQRTADRQAGHGDDDDDDSDAADPFSAEELEKYQYIEPSTGARLTDASAIPVIYRYCSQLPRDAYCTLAPVWEIHEVSQANFICNLTFPINAHIRYVPGEVTRSKARAKRIVALRACIELRKIGALDERLLPYKLKAAENDLAAYEATLEKSTGVKNAIRVFPRKVPEAWLPEMLAGSGHWYMHTLVVASTHSTAPRYRPMVMATRQPMPNGLDGIELYLDEGATLVRLVPWPRPVFLERAMLIKATEFMGTLFHEVLRKELECKTAGYLLFPLVDSIDATAAGACSIRHIDWEQMVNATSGRAAEHPSVLQHIQEGHSVAPDTMVIDVNKHSQYYEVTCVRHDLSPTTTMAAMEEEEGGGGKGAAAASLMTVKDVLMDKTGYSLKHDQQPLLQVEWIKHRRINYLEPVQHTARRSMERDADTLGRYAVPETCRLMPFKASVFRMGLLLPSFLFRMEAALLAVEYGARFSLSTTLAHLSCAITLPTIHAKSNYERLEMLGDSILKTMTSTSLFVEYPENHEGLLHTRRRVIINNRTLCQHAVDRGLFAYLISRRFNRRHWTPPGFAHKAAATTTTAKEGQEDGGDDDMLIGTPEKVYTIEQGDGHVLELKDNRVAHNHELAEKMLADVVEASLGASLDSYGPDAALQCAIKLGVPLVGSPSRWSDLARHLPTPEPIHDPALVPVDVKAIEAILGYTFRHPQYLIEAFTHASSQAPITPCYQRLEYLGDAVLDYLIVDLFYHRYPDLAPGELVEMKDATVSNEFLSTVCVLRGLQQHMDYFSDALNMNMDEFTTRLFARRKETKGVGEYWRGLEPPKVLGDLVESSLGAIYLDSGFDLEVARAAFDRLIRPLIDDRITPGKVNVSPKCRLTKTVQKAGCNMFKFDHGEALDDGMYTAVITMHGHVVMEAVGETYKQATAQVAGDFLDRWDAGEGDTLMQHCDCLEKRMRLKAQKEAQAEQEMIDE
ncbi:hypothetical protein SYNPS1DRAFT_27476 [Syncephalis pseudoplumigaleata]|uniref:Dicer-like protein 1 n=1 Tax=Syncephalis pseudoplumigaleata TaxID=1712513 RepID=A0A4P9Z334_9FUNG|nr:hypothetical protein SYNPS1DRAFT_27476 [Syncephalis pseudoplumigaleata]|eukprot:RKP26846.1 hypothetical protein SYNPS1DRAFT_27476 [Syncephalis pseudoplumigaleata]